MVEQSKNYAYLRFSNNNRNQLQKKETLSMDQHSHKCEVQEEDAGGQESGKPKGTPPRLMEAKQKE